MNLRLFLYGMAHVFDFSGSLRDPRVEEILNRSDAEAIWSDWQAVGNDIRRVIERRRDGKTDAPQE